MARGSHPPRVSPALTPCLTPCLSTGLLLACCELRQIFTFSAAFRHFPPYFTPLTPSLLSGSLSSPLLPPPLVFSNICIPPLFVLLWFTSSHVFSFHTSSLLPCFLAPCLFLFPCLPVHFFPPLPSCFVISLFFLLASLPSSLLPCFLLLSRSPSSSLPVCPLASTSARPFAHVLFPLLSFLIFLFYFI